MQGLLDAEYHERARPLVSGRDACVTFSVVVAGGGQTNGPGRADQQLSQPPKKPRTEWGLGLSMAYDAELLEARHFSPSKPLFCICVITRAKICMPRVVHLLPPSWVQSQDKSPFHMATTRTENSLELLCPVSWALGESSHSALNRTHDERFHVLCIRRLGSCLLWMPTRRHLVQQILQAEHSGVRWGIYMLLPEKT